MYYETTPAGLGGTAQFNGNIAAAVWQSYTDGSSVRHGYAYYYDPLNQLTSANYKKGQNGSWSYDLDRYSVQNLSYDLNGNIRQLQRYGATQHQPSLSFGLMDDLAYTYKGNRVIGVNDAVPDIANNGGADFSDGAATGTADP